MSSWAGKRILITGSGQGLGKEIARQLLTLGAEVIVTDRLLEKAQQTVAELSGEGKTAFAYLLDVTDSQGILAFREKLHAERGPIDGLINNAGVVFGGSFLEVSPKDHARTMEVNIIGLMQLTHAFLPDLIAKPESYLVNLTSAAALIALPWGTSYSASKWAVLGFTDSIREELRLQGHRQVRVSAICPSYIATGMFEGARPAHGTWMLRPEKVAYALIRAMEKGKQFVVLPWTIRISTFFGAFMSRRMFHWFCRVLRVNRSMIDWRGHQKG